MLYSLGRFLQAFGLFVLLPLAIAGNALDRLTLAEMLKLAAAGIAIFSVGWLLQQAGKPR